MFRLIGGAVGIAWVLAGWANLPRLDHPQATAAGLAIGGTCVLSYFLGARQTRVSAEASAWAKAEARAAAISSSSSSSQAQVAVVINAENGARVQGQGRLSGLESAPWMVGAVPQSEIEQDVVAQMIEDGMGQEDQYVV
jgi:hypothetical protein